MTIDIVMPNLGFDAQSGIILEWYKQPGDTVAKGEIIALVEADKSNVELESIASGILLSILVDIDKEIEVGTVIAQIGTKDEAKSSPTRISPIAKRMADEQGVDVATIVGSGDNGRIMRRDIEAHLDTDDAIIMALPKVRRAAREAGINLYQLGIFGRPITMDDLAASDQPQSAEKDVSAPIPQPQPITPLREGASIIPLTRIRERIGERMVQSKQEAPHFYVTGEFDLTDAIDRLSKHQAGINDLLQFLTVQSLLQVPELNGHYMGNAVHQYEDVHLAIAVALDTGLISPVVSNANHYSLKGLALQSHNLIQRARDGKLSPQETLPGTFTISNLGIVRQVDHFTAIINPPQIAILAVGTVKVRPVFIDGEFHPRQTVHLTLSGDHRVVDGMHLARFMAAFQNDLDRFTH